MDALKDALKKALMELQVAGSHPMVQAMHEQSEVKAENPESSDRAPSLKAEMLDGDADDSQMMALKGLADRSHAGRPGMGLGDRAADAAKAKMASIQKHKKKK